MQVKVLYEFKAQPNSGELTIYENEILTVNRQDVGEGWWEGTNQRGQTGLFPAGYVEPIGANNDPFGMSAPPPPPPPLQQTMTAVVSSPTQQTNALNNQSSCDFGDGDWGEDDWDDDDDSQASNSQSNYDYYPNTGHSTAPISQLPPITVSGVPSKGPQPQTVRKSFNRFSTFVKSGGEDYILGITKLRVNESDFIYIIESDVSSYKWSPNPNPFRVSVEKPKKETKMKGLKSYIAYQLIPDSTGIQVSRRYKHFDWLHERLQNKFNSIPIPALPDKQISGRYQEEFIEHRRIQLQSWVDRICRHPVLSQSEIWKHFITCTDEKRWKPGKRRAEKDELVGAALFFAIKPPPMNSSLDIATVDRNMDQFNRFISKMDDAVKNLFITCLDQSKKYAGPYKREFTKIAVSFHNLSDSFMFSGVDGLPPNNSLNTALKHTSDTYEEIGKLFAEEPKKDFGPMSDVLHEYKGILTAWPEILQVHKGAINKKKEHQKMLDEGKIDDKSVAQINERADVVTLATLAEINHFQEERIVDFKVAMQHFLTAQIQFYQDVASKLQQTLDYYNF